MIAEIAEEKQSKGFCSSDSKEGEKYHIKDSSSSVNSESVSEFSNSTVMWGLDHADVLHSMEDL